jgi:hypothetical protein
MQWEVWINGKLLAAFVVQTLHPECVNGLDVMPFCT